MFIYLFILINKIDISSLKNAAAKKAKTLENDDSQKATENDGINAKKKIVKKTQPSNDGAESNNENEMEVIEEDKDDVVEDEDADECAKPDNENENTEAEKTDAMDTDKVADADKDDKKKIKIDDNKEKRKKFIRLWCVHCRIECATFKVNKKTKQKTDISNFFSFSQWIPI